MKAIVNISFFIFLIACNNPDTVSNVSKQKQADTIGTVNSPEAKFSVIVLPPYDEIANAGISPDIQEYLENEISKDTNLTLIKFPYKQLMNVPYQNVFDKKYCKPILDKIKADIIVMSKLDQVSNFGNMTKDKWNLRIRIYNATTDSQINSSVTIDSFADDDIKRVLSNRQSDLTTEIKNNR